MNPKEIKQELLTQDNLATAEPIYCVYAWQRIYGLDNCHSENFVYLSVPNDYQEIKDIAGLREFIKEEKIEIFEPLTDEDIEQIAEENWEFEKVYYKDVRRFITPCFTMKSANRYIKANKHNLNRPHVFVQSLNRNEEMIAIRKMLMGEK